MALGHTRIAVISGTKNLRSCTERLEGYKLALQEANINYDPKLVYYAEYSPETGAQAAKQIVSDFPDISAIFSFGDLMSIGVLHILSKIGYKVPQDISVISVDDISLAPFCNPPLTTVAQPMDEIGELSMTTLIDLIEKKTPVSKLSILPHKLVCRESTSRCKEFK